MEWLGSLWNESISKQLINLGSMSGELYAPKDSCPYGLSKLLSG